MIDRNKAKRQFNDQRWLAKSKRNIEWHLTFDEWCDIWDKSGKWHQRGRCKGQYQMSRYNDEGPYSVDNVYIQTFEENLAEYRKNPRNIQTNIQRGLTQKGKSKPQSAEHTKKVIAEFLSRPLKTCIHCGKTADGMNIGRWHNDRCKQRKVAA